MNICTRRKFIINALSLSIAGVSAMDNLYATLDSKSAQASFIPVMLTPYKEDLSIDFYGLEKLTDLYLHAGAKGLFANCLSSEMYSLEQDERIAITRTTVKRAGQHTNVVATGSFGNSIKDKADFTNLIYEMGANSVILITSHFAEKSDNPSVLIDNIYSFLNHTSRIPLGTYECPTPYKRLLSETEFKMLSDTNRFFYHKDTSENIEEIQKKIQISSANGSYKLYNAHAETAVSSIRQGAAGISPIAGNLFPNIFSWLCRYATDERKKLEVDWMQRELNLVQKTVSLKYPLGAKYFLRKMGLPININSRMQTQMLTKDDIIKLDNLFIKYQSWCEQLGIKPLQV